MEDSALPLGAAAAQSTGPRSKSRRSKEAPPSFPFRELARLFYVHNPFYAISASLVFWGLESSFNLNVYSFQMFALMGGLVAYTLILALAAFVVIRIGKVWDDGRSLLLLVILLLLAMSISLDGALTKYPARGTLCSLAGLLFSVLVSEGLLRGLAIRLPALFRLPFYLALGLFFLYPVALRWTLFDDPFDPGIQWALLAFPVLAAIICLTLLPAVRRGPRYVKDNGTPWLWPWYPWTAFFMIGLGVCGRSFYLCMSMHMAGGFTTIFAPYFLVPFLLAVILLLLEGGIVAGSARVTRAAMLAPLGLVLLALIPPGGTMSERFLDQIFRPAMHSGPLLLTSLAVAGFYIWAVLRRVEYAIEALCGALLLLAFVGPMTLDASTLSLPPRAWPIVAIGAIQGVIALRQPTAARWFAAACCAVAAMTLAFNGTTFMAYRGTVPGHLLLAAAMLLGGLFQDRFARGLQNTAAALLLVAAVTVLTGDRAWFGDLPPLWLSIYPGLVVLVAAGYGWLVRNRLYFLSAVATLACWLVIGSLQGYRQLRVAVSGLDYVVYGAASLVVAMIISLGKSGLVQRRLARYHAAAPERSEHEG